MKKSIYIFADLLNSCICVNTCNFWITTSERETGLYQTGSTSYQLLETRQIEVNINFDFTTGKIQALEHKLGDLHVQAENIKAQIQELKCIGHEKNEDEDPDFDHGNGDPSSAYDDDIPF